MKKCFCLGFGKKKQNKRENESEKSDEEDHQTQPTSDTTRASPNQEVAAKEEEDQFSQDVRDLNLTEHADAMGKKAKTFTLRELKVATTNFNPDLILGEGGFGNVFKGTLEIENVNQVVAVKQLNTEGFQGIREFVAEVLTLSLVDHPNLVKLIGYCAEGDQRLLVYEYMPLGSLEKYLFDVPVGRQPLDWNTRMKIAVGVARGLEYLHEKMEPPVIYRDLKCPNVLLNQNYEPKLSDFGLAKFGPEAGKSHVSTRVMGTVGYCAPEYALTGQLTFKSDVFTFGVVLLELITGREAINRSRRRSDRLLVRWARKRLKKSKYFDGMADPLLRGQYPQTALYKALGLSAMCIQDDPNKRPVVSDLVVALDHLATIVYDPNSASSSSSGTRTGRNRDRDGEGTSLEPIQEAEAEGGGT